MNKFKFTASQLDNSTCAHSSMKANSSSYEEVNVATTVPTSAATTGLKNVGKKDSCRDDAEDIVYDEILAETMKDTGNRFTLTENKAYQKRTKNT